MKFNESYNLLMPFGHGKCVFDGELRTQFCCHMCLMSRSKHCSVNVGIFVCLANTLKNEIYFLFCLYI